MSVNRRRLNAAFVSCCLVGLSSGAANAQNAHVHGAAQLSIAALEGQVLIELLSPAANLVGFENKADNKKQRQQVLEANQLLNNGNDLFTFSNAKCQLTKFETNIKDVLLADDDDHDDKHSDHGKHHDDNREKHHKGQKNKHKHHDEHHHADHRSHDEHPDDQEAHSDIAVTYEYTCNNGQLPSAINVQLINRFGGIETLTTEWVTAVQQGAVEVSQSNTRVSLK